MKTLENLFGWACLFIGWPAIAIYYYGRYDEFPVGILGMVGAIFVSGVIAELNRKD